MYSTEYTCTAHDTVAIITSMTAVSPSTNVPIPSRKLPICAHSHPRSTGVPPWTKCHSTT